MRKLNGLLLLVLLSYSCLSYSFNCFEIFNPEVFKGFSFEPSTIDFKVTSSPEHLYIPQYSRPLGLQKQESTHFYTLLSPDINTALHFFNKYLEPEEFKSLWELPEFPQALARVTYKLKKSQITPNKHTSYFIKSLNEIIVSIVDDVGPKDAYLVYIAEQMVQYYSFHKVDYLEAQYLDRRLSLFKDSLNEKNRVKLHNNILKLKSKLKDPNSTWE